ncbi:MAG TPA: hypothetical protein DCF33_07180, partial [Saprospirales bacterium]|nr:hypothetical protein [Saprospirales bacterium]
FNTPGFGGRSHLLLAGVSNQLLINSCSFNNAFNTPLPNPTIFGILSFNSGFKVTNGGEADDPSAFTNLSYGIYASGFKTAGVTVKSSIFTDCNVGIYGIGTNFFAVSENMFNLGKLPTVTTPYSLPDQFGVWFKDAFPILSVTGNTFQRYTFTNPAPDHTIGSFAQNVGDFNNLFSENDYDQIDFANLANENNGNQNGLHYLCNNNFGPQLYDFAVEQNASIRQNQGQGNVATGGFNAAANTFSYTNGNNGDFSDFLNDGGFVRYYWRNAPNEKPLDFFNLNLIQVPTGAGCADREICPEPCKTPTEIAGMKNEYPVQKTAWLVAQNAATQAQQTGNTALMQQYDDQANIIRDRIDYLVGSIISDEIGTLNRPDTIRKWLSNFERIEAEFYIARNLFNLNDSTAADSILQLISSKFNLNTAQAQEIAAMRQLVAVLSGKDIFALNEATKTALESFAQKELSHSGDWARGILLHYGYWFQPTYKLPEPSRQRNSDPNAGIIFNSVHLFPNPAHQRLQVNMPGNPDIGTLQIFNALGELIMILGVASEEESTTINISDLPSGIYFVRLDRGGQNIFSEKLVIQS